MSESVPAFMPRTGAGDEVELRVRAASGQLPIIRSLTGHIALRADFDLDMVADLKLAVDEACSTLISRAATEAVLTCRFTVAPDEIRFTATVESSDRDQPPRNTFGWHVLVTLTDHVTTRVEPPDGSTDGHRNLVHIELMKQRATAKP